MHPIQKSTTSPATASASRPEPRAKLIEVRLQRLSVVPPQQHNVVSQRPLQQLLHGGAAAQQADPYLGRVGGAAGLVRGFRMSLLNFA